MRLIVAGSRGITDKKLVWSVLDKLSEDFFISEVLEGECKNSPDILAREWAKDRGYSYKGFPANWSKYGITAGHKRNIKMGQKGDMLVAFWDGKSLGTRGMIGEMMVWKKPFILIPVGWGYTDASNFRRHESKTKKSGSIIERLGLRGVRHGNKRT